MADASRFWDKTADKYAKKPIKDMESYERTLDRTREQLAPGDRVLELGCGTGTTALLLAPSVAHLRATDISPRMIEIARGKAAEQGVKNVDFACATVADGGFEKESFDAVLAFNLLHLLEDLPGAVRRVHELLKPGGRFVSKTVCLGEQTRLWGLLLGVMKPLGLAPPVFVRTIADVEGAITGAGFEILETGRYGTSLPTHFVVARKP